MDVVPAFLGHRAVQFHPSRRHETGVTLHVATAPALPGPMMKSGINPEIHAQPPLIAGPNQLIIKATQIWGQGHNGAMANYPP